MSIFLILTDFKKVSLVILIDFALT